MSFELDKELFVSKVGSSKAHQGLQSSAKLGIFQVLSMINMENETSLGVLATLTILYTHIGIVF